MMEIPVSRIGEMLNEAENMEVDLVDFGEFVAKVLVEKDKKKKLLNFVSDITEESLRGISKPKLRLNKFPKKN